MRRCLLFVLVAHVPAIVGCSADTSDSGGDSLTTFESDDFVVVIDGDDSAESRTARVTSRDGVEVLTLVVTRERVVTRFPSGEPAPVYEFETPLESLPHKADLVALAFYVAASVSPEAKALAVAPKDAPGCDRIPPEYETQRRLKCCADHDYCFHRFACTEESFKDWSGLCFSECNLPVIQCWLDDSYETSVVDVTCYDASCSEPPAGPLDPNVAGNFFSCEGTAFGAQSCECLSPCEDNANACDELLRCCPELTDEVSMIFCDVVRADGGAYLRDRRRICAETVARSSQCSEGVGGTSGTGGFGGAGGQGGMGGSAAMGGMGGMSGSGGDVGTGGAGGARDDVCTLGEWKAVRSGPVLGPAIGSCASNPSECLIECRFGEDRCFECLEACVPAGVAQLVELGQGSEPPEDLMRCGTTSYACARDRNFCVGDRSGPLDAGISCMFERGCLVPDPVGQAGAPDGICTVEQWLAAVGVNGNEALRRASSGGGANCSDFWHTWYNTEEREPTPQELDALISCFDQEIPAYIAGLLTSPATEHLVAPPAHLVSCAARTRACGFAASAWLPPRDETSFRCGTFQLFGQEPPSCLEWFGCVLP